MWMEHFRHGLIKLGPGIVLHSFNSLTLGTARRHTLSNRFSLGKKRHLFQPYDIDDFILTFLSILVLKISSDIS